MSYISASGVSYKFPDSTTLFSNINFTFKEERSAIVGKNGVGKTTLLNLIQKKVPPSSGAILNGVFYEVLPQNLNSFDSLDVLEVLGVKKTYTAYLNIISGNYTESCYNDLNNRWDIVNEIHQSLSTLGLDALEFDRSYTSLSGGEKVRLLFSKILLSKPDFFLLDEPTNNLDNETKEYIYNFIKSWKKGLIIISHDRTLLDLMDHIYELSAIGIKHYMGNYTFYSEKKELERLKLQQDIITANKKLKKVKNVRDESLKKHIKRAKRGEKNRGSIPKIVADGWKGSSEKRFGSLNIQSQKRVEDAKKQYDQLTQKRESSLKIRVDLLGEVKHKNKILVDAESINFKYSNKYLWEKDLSFEIRGQEKVRIVGRNGSGKSTLCRIITGELSSVNGRISVNLKRISILDQNVSCINEELTLLENIEQYAKADVPEHRLRIILGGFLFYGNDVFKKAAVLSGGEKMRLAMACNFSTESEAGLLILDEPTNNLDLESIEQLTQSVKEYSGAMIIISHDDYFIRSIGIDRTIYLS